MAITDVFRRALSGELRLARGRVASIEPDGRVRVRFGSGNAQEITCEVLRAGAEAPGCLVPGSEVLLACADEPERSGVILGAVGTATMNVEAPAASIMSPDQPLHLGHREIVIEAGEELTLKCGEASIKISRDGKIVIRGEHILSRAKGTQRIKGGSVAIN